MISPSVGGGRRRLYHEGLLVVKVRADAGPALGRFAARGISRAVAPGLSALERLQTSGTVRRLTAVARPTRHGPSPDAGLVAHLLGARARTGPADLNAHLHLVDFADEGPLESTRQSLAADPHVEYAARVPVRYLAVRQARRVPTASTPWNLRRIAWAEARRLRGFKDATRIAVGMLDSGIDTTHPDLKGQPAEYVFAHRDLAAPSSPKDLIGHGTHVAGTIAALINNRLGINGICRCRLHVWKIFSDTPEFDPDQLAFLYVADPVRDRRALADCAARDDLDVINFSIGGNGRPDPQERKLFKAIIARGTVAVAAMGNERQSDSPTSYPAALPGVIAVGATSLDDSVAEFSNRGRHIALAAPGTAIWSTLPTYPGQLGFHGEAGPDGKPVPGRPIRRKKAYGAWDGTSMAAPHVTAAVALLIANAGPRTPDAIREHLMRTADRVPAMGRKTFDWDFGAGRLNLARLLRQRRRLGVAETD